MQYKDYYQILGVSKTATHDEVRKAFRGLARKYHPDVAKDKKTAEDKFKEVNEAYEVLGDAEKRKKYDQLGSGGFPPPRRGQARRGAQGMPEGDFSFGGTGFSDFFEQYFGGGGGRGFGFGDQAAADHRGSDLEADLLVTLEEAMHGAKKKISLRRGETAKTETYEIRIPAGVREGQKIRLAGQGEGVGRSARAGDLYLRVRFARHPDFRVEGADLYQDLEIPVWQAVLGAETEIRTLDGSIRLKIPAGSQYGRKFRLRERGLPTEGGGRGDFYVALQITIPEVLTEKQKNAWEILAEVSKPAASE